MSEAIALNGKLQPEVNLHFRGHEIPLSKTVKYLGVVLDKGLTGSPHIRYAAAKASAVSGQLGRLLPKTSIAKDRKRRLLGTVAENIMLYAAVTWSKAREKKCNHILINRCQRQSALRLARCNRTVSTNAAILLAQQLPWILKAQARAKQAAYKEAVQSGANPPSPIEEAW